MDKLVTLKPDGGRDLIDMMDDAEGKVRILYHALDGAAMYAEGLADRDMGQAITSLLQVMQEYTRSIRSDLDEVLQALLHDDAAKTLTKGGAKK